MGSHVHVLLPWARVLSSALAVEVSSSWYTCASIEAGIRSTGADSNFTVSTHERSSALTEISYNTTLEHSILVSPIYNYNDSNKQTKNTMHTSIRQWWTCASIGAGVTGASLDWRSQAASGSRFDQLLQHWVNPSNLRQWQLSSIKHNSLQTTPQPIYHKSSWARRRPCMTPKEHAGV